MRKLIGFGLLLLTMSPLAFADSITASSRISDVIVYPGAAVVTRTAEIDLPLGDHTVLFDNIIPQINENALTVKGQGHAEVKIFGASLKREFLTQSANERVKDLQSKIELLEDQRALMTEMQKVLGKKTEYLDSLRLKAGEQLPKDMQTKMPTALELQDLGAYLNSNYEDVMTKSDENRKKLRELEREHLAMTQELYQIQGSAQQEKRSIAVDVQCTKPGKMKIMVSYLVSGVNWVPNYDARVDFARSSTELSLFALVSQVTGEEWSGVTLTLSTSRPTLGGQMPELSTWNVSPMVAYRALKQAMRYESSDGMAAASLSNAPTQVAGYDAPMEKMEANNIATVALAQSESRGVSVVFKITKPVDIKSDGATHRVPVLLTQMPSVFEYAATPKLSSFAYLKAGVSNAQESTLLPGQVNVYMDGDFVGNSALNKAIGSNEKFDLFLGVDEGVTLKRTLISKKSDDTMFGGIPSPNMSIAFSYKITVENYKNKNIAIKVYENIPVATDDKIKVKDIKFVPEVTKKDVDDRAGVMRWSLDLGPGEKKDIVVSYVVEYPRSLTISGL